MSTLTATTRPDFANPLQRLAPGLALALLATWLAAQAWAARLGLSALTLAIVLGMLGYQRLQARADAGVGFAKHWLLRAGIVLFGMRITFQDIGSVGWRGVAIDALMLVSTLGLAVLLGRRWLRLDATTIFDAAGQPSEAILVFCDVTEEREKAKGVFPRTSRAFLMTWQAFFPRRRRVSTVCWQARRSALLSGK